jgi:prepilin-type N-terminal cleavage/methylation domain-containing protein
MQRQVKRHHRTTDRAGFTVVECLIGLAISAMLMTALAVAFNASIINFRENEETFESVNNIRQALTRMTSELRTADGVLSTTPANQCIFCSGSDPSQVITYEYRDSSDPNDPNTLMLVKNGTAYTLCDKVTAATFTKTPADGDPIDSKSVLISLTVECGGRERTLSAAAVVRRALEF